MRLLLFQQVAFGLGCGAALFLPPSREVFANSDVRFVDITRPSGIHFVHGSAPEKKYIVESMSGGVILFDYDNDGWLDLYFVNSLTVDTARKPRSAQSQLYRNHHDGTFRDVSEESGAGYPGWGMGGCSGDFDGDGWLDLYVTALGSNRLYRNNGNGTFAEMAAKVGVDDERWSAGCAFGDYDRDGDLDLFVSNYVDFKMEDLPEFGKGSFCQYRGVPVQCGPRGLPGAGDALFENDGKGHFSDVSQRAGVSDPEGYYGLGVVWFDLDEDGFPDLFVANDSRPNFLYHNKGNGTFEEIGFLSGVAVGEDGSEQGSMGVAVGDYDRDGDLDLFISNFSDEYNTLYRHDQALVFTDISFSSRTAEVSFPYVGWGTAWFDYDNDGWLDLLVVNGHVYPQVDQANIGIRYAQRKLLYHNNRDGTFEEVAGIGGAPFLARTASRGAAFGDLDNDGDVDVVVNDLDGAPMLLRNDGGNRSSWLRVKLVGGAKNAFALGARVKVVSGSLVQKSEVHSGSSYISQSDLRLHFGLGARKMVDLVEVVWPDGTRTELKKIPVNQEITVKAQP
ncbi:MAG: CRTAC1 family protein [Acidobacteriota bacterium]